MASQSHEIVPISSVLYEIMPQKQLDLHRIYGTATIIEDGRIFLENNNADAAFNQVVLNVSENTMILDAVSGLPKSIKDIRENEMLYAYISPVMTMSLPPITNPELILTSIPADFAVPSYEEIDRVEQGEEGSVVVHTNNDKTYTVTDDTVLFPYLTRNIVTKHSLNPGTKLLVWQQPAIDTGDQEAAPTSTKMMVFPYSYSAYAEASLHNVVINGEALELVEGEQPYVENGRLMIPFRKFVEALGFQIEWDPASSGIRVVNGDVELYSFTAGGTEVVQGEFTHTLREAATVLNGVSFMAIEDLIHLNNVKLAQ